MPASMAWSAVFCIWTPATCDTISACAGCRRLQNIISPVQHGDPRNNALLLKDGGIYPITYTFLNEWHIYQAFLPSANFVYEVADDFQVRASFSRTMTRPNVNNMIDVVSFGDVAVTNATKGNPTLKPYFSNNIDLGAELYTGGAGYIGIDVFRKSISGFTITTSFNQTLPLSGAIWHHLRHPQPATAGRG